MILAITDPELSARYRIAYSESVRRQVLDDDGRFCCVNGTTCRSSVGAHGFAAGQLSYVGDHYAAVSDGAPLRVLIVSMQVGDDEAPVTLDRRREQMRARIPEPFGGRNQHMAGVTTALRILFGGEPGADRQGELLDTPAGTVHVLDAFAMANSVLCSRRPGQGREGAPSKTMIANCSAYLRATIEALEPTVIHSQGRGAAWSTHQAIELVSDETRPIDDHLSRIRVGHVEAIWCSLKHPARNWGQLGRSYLHDVAAPALHRARCLAVKGPTW